MKPTFCARCDLSLPRDSRFCSRCGSAVSRPKTRKPRRRWLIPGAVIAALLILLAPALLYVWAGLPGTPNLSTARLPLSTRIYDRTGTVLLAEIRQGSDRRQIIPLAQMAPTIQKATVAVEDRTFYQHHGLNLLRTGQAGFQDLTHWRIEGGGSTITQQLARNVYLSGNRSLLRKVQEMILAVEIDRQYSKAQILEAYLNRVYYGNHSYGIEAAARTYFGKAAAQLSAGEATLLAGLPQAPSDLDPYTNLTGAKSRQRVVLDAMVRGSYLSRADASSIFAEKLTLQKPSVRDDVKAGHFVHWVAAQLEKAYGNEMVQKGGLTVITSLDWRLQSIGEKQVREQVLGLGNQHVTDGAMVALDPKTGEVLAMVGSAGLDVPGGEFNMALVPRQPGSSFKVFTYTSAIESGKFTMASWVLDEPLNVRLPDGSVYRPHNYDGRYRGWVQVPQALGNSLNVPAVRVELDTGIERVVETAKKMGTVTLNRPPNFYQPSLTLGGYEVPLIEMASGVNTLAARGIYRQPQALLKVLSKDSKPLYTYDPSANGKQATSPEVSFIVSEMLSDDRNRTMAFGRSSDLVIPGHRVAAKTGTTSDFRDNLALGYTPGLAVGVWVGNADHSPMRSVTGIVGAAPIFNSFMKEALAGQPDQWFPVPAGLKTINSGGYLAYLLPGTERTAMAAQPRVFTAGGGNNNDDGDD